MLQVSGRPRLGAEPADMTRRARELENNYLLLGFFGVGVGQSAAI